MFFSNYLDVGQLKNFSALIGVLLFFAGYPEASCATTENEPSAAAAIDSVLARASSDGSGYAAIVEIDGEIILSKGYGKSDRKRNIAFTPNTIAQIGSLTKQFTATAVLNLVSKGQVNLDAPISTYIPGLTPPVADVNVHQLLTHQSGLAEYCGSDFHRMSRDEFVKKCLHKRLAVEPGTDSSYSNVGYSALAAIVSSASGQSFARYLDEEILRPNGLNRTGHFLDEGSEDEMAHGYLGRRDKGIIAAKIRQLGDEWWGLQGAGGMQASTLDMYQWYKVLNGAGSLDEDVRKALTSPHALWVDGLAEGYGWYFRSDASGRLRQMSHSGSDGVFFSYYWHRLDEQVFMYFVGNSGEKQAKDVLREILSILNSNFDRTP